MRLEASAGAGRQSAVVAAWTTLPRPVYSHLNDWCRIRVSDVGSPSLAFSPSGATAVPVGGSRDALGRSPVRLAYLDAARRLQVVEASFGEKGPFRTIASGPVGADETVAITFLDGGLPVARIVLEDWARQADTTSLSPTAGWGLPPNAIEFHCDEEGDVVLHVTLAGTAVGRGWDTVGHRAGTYRNRMRIDLDAR